MSPAGTRPAPARVCAWTPWASPATPEGVVAHHSVYGGAYSVDAAVTWGAPVITVRQGAIDARADAVASPAVETLAVRASGKRAAAVDARRRGRDRLVATGAARRRRRSSPAVADSGRQEKFVLVEQLADALGAAVGRVARRGRRRVRAAVVPGRPDRVSRCAPQLYVALGISGAIQHKAGMQTAKTIVAINKDADAPIFEIADFGVVGDLFTVVPQLISALEARKA